MACDVGLDCWKVPLDNESLVRWKEHYGINGVYINDIAAGAIIEIGKDWSARFDKPVATAASRVAEGLRHLVQELFRFEMIRPVIGVFFTAGDVEPDLRKRLRRMTWDDELHRGDFTLREAENRADAKALLGILMGDTVGELDADARADKVGVPEVLDSFVSYLGTLKKTDADAETRLVTEVIDSLRATQADRNTAARSAPALKTMVDLWAKREAGS